MLSITTEILTLADIYGIFTVYSICNDLLGDIKLSNIEYFYDFSGLFILRCLDEWFDLFPLISSVNQFKTDSLICV